MRSSGLYGPWPPEGIFTMRCWWLTSRGCPAGIELQSKQIDYYTNIEHCSKSRQGASQYGSKTLLSPIGRNLASLDLNHDRIILVLARPQVHATTRERQPASRSCARAASLLVSCPPTTLPASDFSSCLRDPHLLLFETAGQSIRTLNRHWLHRPKPTPGLLKPRLP